MERVTLWRRARQKRIGVVELDDQKRLIFHIEDDQERDRVTELFKQAGEVKWAWTRYGENDWEEHRAEPLTPAWFWFVVLNILLPKGYQTDAERTENV